MGLGELCRLGRARCRIGAGVRGKVQQQHWREAGVGRKEEETKQ